uniref:Protein kinase domain-containing protein n=1 Tax=Tanacetum cinerariifolium TaxID=118510 RepID=A0A6L2KQF6_TANCI|nr:hypothetical protein [Tanacetum cinerariifolium]
METEVRGRASELAAGSSHVIITNFVEVRSSKRAAEAELDYEESSLLQKVRPELVPQLVETVNAPWRKVVVRIRRAIVCMVCICKCWLKWYVLKLSGEGFVHGIHSIKIMDHELHDRVFKIWFQDHVVGFSRILGDRCWSGTWFAEINRGLLNRGLKWIIIAHGYDFIIASRVVIKAASVSFQKNIVRSHGRDRQGVEICVIFSSVTSWGEEDDGRRPTITDRLAVALGVAQGIKYFHTHADKTSHGNIKSVNILVTTGLQVYVLALGLPSTSYRFTAYRAPEWLEKLITESTWSSED